MSRPALIIHGHFYQPPRENPWTGIVDREPSAAPFHDWNQRIHAECYRPNGWARIFDDVGVRDIVNNYRHLSFNFGPTLLSWLQRHQPATLRRIIAADKASVTTLGHGSAIAQAYNHTILPLMVERDIRTQVRWGLVEFRHRFGRAADAMWLPETACDDRTLGVLIDEGLKYALLAPGQAARVKLAGGWRDVSDGSIDPRRPYRYLHRDGSGRELALFFYDGAISRAIAFEGGLASSSALVDRFAAAAAGGGLVHAATDGESYGHHHRWGERCLAHALSVEAERRGFAVTNYAAYLAENPPTLEVEIGEGDDGLGTSWSCAHGVGRWFRDCGCHTGGQPGWNQRWRKPLREALDVLRDRAAAVFEEQCGALCPDPWGLRDAYVELLLDPSRDRKRFFRETIGRDVSDGETRALCRQLEAQRAAMLMYTSCGWFFNELSGIETLQVMRYAGHLVDQLAAMGVDAEETFLAGLAEAQSNLGDTGADLYRREVLPRRVVRPELAAHIALMRLPGQIEARGEIAGHRFELREYEARQRGRVALAVSHIHLEAIATGETSDHAACAIHFGGVDLHCVLREHPGSDGFAAARDRILAAFDQGTLLNLLRVAEEELGPDDYSLAHVLPSAREAISNAMFENLRARYAAQYEAMYQEAQAAIEQFLEVGLPLPRELRTAIELSLTARFEQQIAAAPRMAFDVAAYETAREIAAEAKRYGCALRTETAARHFEALLVDMVQRVCTGDAASHSGSTGPVADSLRLIGLARELGVAVDLDRAQELLHEAMAGAARDDAQSLELAAELGLSVPPRQGRRS